MFNERLEVDGAKAARELLTTYNVPEEQTRTAWQAIALHTTTRAMKWLCSTPVLVPMSSEKDLINFLLELRDVIVRTYPRKHFKKPFLQEYFCGVRLRAGDHLRDHEHVYL